VSTRKHTIGDVTFYGTLADTAAEINDEQWAYYELMDKLTDMIAVFMEDHEVSRTALASYMGKSKAFVSKVLAGDAHNMTMKTLSSIVHNLEARIEVKIVSKLDSIRWIGVVKNEQWLNPQHIHPWTINKFTTNYGLSATTEPENGKETLAA